jgi:hypothetical protein
MGMWVAFPNELHYPLACSKTHESGTKKSVRTLSVIHHDTVVEFKGLIHRELAEG